MRADAAEGIAAAAAAARDLNEVRLFCSVKAGQ
jgi:hypothetical protein